jgi:hypothetical protein
VCGVTPWDSTGAVTALSEASNKTNKQRMQTPFCLGNTNIACGMVECVNPRLSNVGKNSCWLLAEVLVYTASQEIQSGQQSNYYTLFKMHQQHDR